MAISKIREFQCEVVHELVRISLSTKRTGGFRSRDKLYVKCNQVDCQYAEENLEPCPLSLTMFEKEIQEREEKARLRHEDSSYH